MTLAISSDSRDLSSVILDKIREQAERTQHLLALVAPDNLQWRPSPAALPLCELLGHLLECMSGFCAALYGMRTERLSHFLSLRELQVNHHCGIDETRDRINDYLIYIEEGFSVITDEDLARHVPTLFVAEGEPALSLLLANLEHLINHKYQLFFYLKMLGVPVATRDLYHLRSD